MGQYFAICRSVLVRQCGSDNVEVTLFILNQWNCSQNLLGIYLGITPLDNSDNVEATTNDTFRIP